MFDGFQVQSGSLDDRCVCIIETANEIAERVSQTRHDHLVVVDTFNFQQPSQNCHFLHCNEKQKRIFWQPVLLFAVTIPRSTPDKREDPPAENLALHSSLLKSSSTSFQRMSAPVGKVRQCSKSGTHCIAICECSACKSFHRLKRNVQLQTSEILFVMSCSFLCC